MGYIFWDATCTMLPTLSENHLDLQGRLIQKGRAYTVLRYDLQVALFLIISSLSVALSHSVAILYGSLRAR